MNAQPPHAHVEGRGVFGHRWIRTLGLAPWLAAGVAWAQIPLGDKTITLQPVASGLVSPVALTHAGDGSGRLFIVDQAGYIRIVKDGALLPTPFLDLTGELPVLSTGFDERGLLGLAFHPDYASNGRFFVRYSRPRAGSMGEPCFGTSRGCHTEVLAEYSVSGDPDLANTTGMVLFEIDEPEFNHNAGAVAFGPDSYLYFTLGDGGGANDGLDEPGLPHGPEGNGQNVETALGAMLRIDVDGGFPYAIPADNPFVGTTGLDEIWAYGMRNPFTFSFDDGPGGDNTLYLGDVGQDLFEELNIIVKGGNYGWAIREGAHCFDPFNPDMPPANCDSTGLIDPIAEYTQAEGGVSIIVGSVYRGTRSPGLVGTLVLGDFSADFGPTGRLYYLIEPSPGTYALRQFSIGRGAEPLGEYLKGLGEDEAGEVYALTSTELAPTGSGGSVYRIQELLFGDADEDGDVDLADHDALVACLTGPGGSLSQTVDVQVGGAGFSFTPADVAIAEGDTVHWFWAGGFHNVESGVGGVHDGNFRSGNPTSNTSMTFDVTFDAAFLAANPMMDNVYPYYCAPHEGFGMIGTVTVGPNACSVFDYDADGDVDLADWGAFQAAFTGAP